MNSSGQPSTGHASLGAEAGPAEHPLYALLFYRLRGSAWLPRTAPAPSLASLSSHPPPIPVGRRSAADLEELRQLKEQLSQLKGQSRSQLIKKINEYFKRPEFAEEQRAPKLGKEFFGRRR